jgi:4-amino-4-deoxy-L-arabinose transferase-like glycosyltransferase
MRSPVAIRKCISDFQVPLSRFIKALTKAPVIQATAVFCAGVILGILVIQFVPIRVDIQMRTKEKGSLQLFVDAGSGFNEGQSKRIDLSNSLDFSHHVMSMRTSEVRAIRIDPLETKGQFELLGLEIDYLLWQRKWSGHRELHNLFTLQEVEVKSTEGAVFSGLSQGQDPSLTIADMKFLQQWQLIATVFSAFVGGFTALLFSVSMRYFGVKTVFSNRHIPLITIIFTAAVLRLFYWGQSGLPFEPSQLQKIWFDEGTYFSLAQFIVSNGLIQYFLSEQSVMTTPVNPVYLAFMYKVSNSIDFIRLFNIFLSVLSVVLVYKIGEKTFNKQVGFLAALICSVHGQLIQYSATLLTEPLFFFFFMAWIHCLIITLDGHNQQYYKQGYALASTVFLTSAILTRSIALLLPFFLLFAIVTVDIYRSWRGEKPLFTLAKCAVLPLLLPVIIVSILAFKNYVVLDRLMVATGSGASLWLGSRSDTEGDEPPYRGQSYDTQKITNGLSHLSIEGDMLLMAEAKNNIRKNPLKYTWWSLKKIGRLIVGSNLAWFYPHKNISDWYWASGRNFLATANMAFQIILASAIAVYGMIGFAVARGHDSSRLIICASACYLILFSVPFLAIQRYGLPLVLLLVLPASAVMHGAWHASGRLRRVALFGLPFLTAIVSQILLVK